MSRPIVAALQMVSGADIDTNLAHAEKLIAQAATQGAKLIVLPEAFALFLGSEQKQLGAIEASSTPRVRTFLAEQALRHRVWLIGGTIPVLDHDLQRPRAACFVLDDNGHEVARYDKIHLFDVDVGDRQGSYRESDSYQHGTDIVTVQTPFGCVGIAVCYDLRFPELFQLLRAQGAEILVLPSAFTRATGLAHWLPLLRARAIETTRADNHRLEALSQTDPLTQLVNRRALTVKLVTEMERVRRYNAPLTMLLVDLDDRYGRQADGAWR